MRFDILAESRQWAVHLLTVVYSIAIDRATEAAKQAGALPSAGYSIPDLAARGYDNIQQQGQGQNR